MLRVLTGTQRLLVGLDTGLETGRLAVSATGWGSAWSITAPLIPQLMQVLADPAERSAYVVSRACEIVPCDLAPATPRPGARMRGPGVGDAVTLDPSRGLQFLILGEPIVEAIWDPITSTETGRVALPPGLDFNGGRWATSTGGRWIAGIGFPKVLWKNPAGGAWREVRLPWPERWARHAETQDLGGPSCLSSDGGVLTIGQSWTLYTEDDRDGLVEHPARVEEHQMFAFDLRSGRSLWSQNRDAGIIASSATLTLVDSEIVDAWTGVVRYRLANEELCELAEWSADGTWLATVHGDRISLYSVPVQQNPRGRY